jgi:hypothetical protein
MVRGKAEREPSQQGNVTHSGDAGMSGCQDVDVGTGSRGGCCSGADL